MAFSISKLFHKNKPIVKPEIILNQIDYKEGTKFAENNTHKVYIDIEELGGFPYLKTVLFGIENIKIKRVGCTISFIFSDAETITLTSDNTDIESDELKNSGIFHTAIDFELDANEAQKIQNGNVLEVHYMFKKNTLKFSKSV